MVSQGGRFQFHHHRRWLPAKFSHPLTIFTLLWILVFVLLFAWESRFVYRTLLLSRVAPQKRHVPERLVPNLRPVVVNLLDFGAVGDGRTLNTEAFESAVAVISRHWKIGGGQLDVPRGRWLTAPFNLTSHMTLFLEEGAIILGIQDENYWPLMGPLPSYGCGRELPGPRYGSLIHGQHLKDVVITGHNGTIDGQGQSWWMKFKNKLLKYNRGPLVQIMWSRDIVISNITLRDSPFWTIHPYDCRNVTLSGLTIFAPLTRAPNTDGIDPDSCQDMLIENCYISVGDDGIAIKSGWDQYGTAYGRPSANILIRNLTLQSTVSAGLSIGSEMSGGVTNVTLQDTRIWNSRRGVRIKTAPGRGGYVRGIAIRNLTLDNVRLGIVAKTDYNEHPDSGYDPRALPDIDGLSFVGVRGRRVRFPVRLRGTDEIPLRGVMFEDMSVEVGRQKNHIFLCSHVEGRAVGPVFPAPCQNLDHYDEHGRLMQRGVRGNTEAEMEYEI